MIYACQKNAWMDEIPMLTWVKKVLKPHVKKATKGIIPLLLLDEYHCHMMGSVVESIKKHGCEVEHIPGAHLAQPVNIGCNKPLKTRCRDLWEMWMMESGLSTGTTMPPTCELIAQWVWQSLEVLPADILRNAWLHGEYSYFLPGPLLQHQYPKENNDKNNDEENGNNNKTNIEERAAV